MASLVKLVQGLPPELFNNIKDLTFTATKGVVAVDRDYKPPTSLQVSKATREQYAISYYEFAKTLQFKDWATFCQVPLQYHGNASPLHQFHSTYRHLSQDTISRRRARAVRSISTPII
jgi:hypothetical protein